MHAIWLTVLATAALIAAPGFAADAYPTRPIRILAGGAAGGPIDIMARVVGQKLSEQLGQSFVIDNRGGAGGTIATRIAAQGAPDGYTLLCNSSQYVVAPSLYRDPGYDPFKSFAPIINAGVSPKAIVNKLNHDIAAILRLPETKERLAVLGFDPINNTPDEFTAYIKVEVTKWAKVIKDSGARVD